MHCLLWCGASPGLINIAEICKLMLGKLPSFCKLSHLQDCSVHPELFCSGKARMNHVIAYWHVHDH